MGKKYVNIPQKLRFLNKCIAYYGKLWYYGKKYDNLEKLWYYTEHCGTLIYNGKTYSTMEKNYIWYYSKLYTIFNYTSL